MTFTVHGIPAIPIFAALPTGKHPILRFGLLGLALLMVVMTLPIIRENSLFKSRQFFALRTNALMLLIVTVVAYLSSGELLTSALHNVGVTWWRVSGYFAATSAVVLILTVYIPGLVKRVRARG